MSLVKEDIRKAMEHLDILTAQIGNARIRKLYKDPLKDFIKKVEITLEKGAKGPNALTALGTPMFSARNADHPSLMMRTGNA